MPAPHEYLAVSTSSHEADALATKLTEHAADGWEVVAIVPSGGQLTAFVRRERADEAAPAVEEAPGVAVEQPEPAPVAEYSPTPTPEPQPVVQVPQAQTAPATAPSVTPAVPAGWYGDPSGRYELRYWDGGQWTEHVARNGQQYTDPPVA
jgi:hypothetical protein